MHFNNFLVFRKWYFSKFELSSDSSELKRDFDFFNLNFYSQSKIITSFQLKIVTTIRRLILASFSNNKNSVLPRKSLIYEQKQDSSLMTLLFWHPSLNCRSFVFRDSILFFEFKVNIDLNWNYSLIHDHVGDDIIFFWNSFISNTWSRFISHRNDSQNNFSSSRSLKNI